MIRGQNFRKKCLDVVIIFFNDAIKFAKFGPKFNCPYLLKDKPLLNENSKLSCLKSKIRKSNIKFHQNFNLVTSLLPKMSKLLNYSCVYYLTFCVSAWK